MLRLLTQNKQEMEQKIRIKADIRSAKMMLNANPNDVVALDKLEKSKTALAALEATPAEPTAPAVPAKPVAPAKPTAPAKPVASAEETGKADLEKKTE
jgi:hypothetical protein